MVYIIIKEPFWLFDIVIKVRSRVRKGDILECHELKP